MGSESDPGFQIKRVVAGRVRSGPVVVVAGPVEAVVHGVLERELDVAAGPEGRSAVLVEGQVIRLENEAVARRGTVLAARVQDLILAAGDGEILHGQSVGLVVQVTGGDLEAVERVRQVFSVAQCLARIPALVLVNPGSQQGKVPVCSGALVLGIEPVIREAVGAFAGVAPGVDRSGHPEGADFPTALARRPFEREAPVRCQLGDLGLPGGIDAHRFLKAGGERPVTGDIEIEAVVDHRIGAKAADLLGDAALDQGRCGRGGCQAGTAEGKTEGRRAVPRILKGRVVVCIDAVDHVVVAGLRLVGEAQLGVVPGPFFGDAIIGDLGEDAEFVGHGGTVGSENVLGEGPEEAAGVEDAGLRHRVIVVVAEARRRAARLRRVGAGDRGHEHDGEGQLFAAVRALRVPGQLEGAAKLVEHGELRVAGRALHVHLTGKAGQGPGRGGCEHETNREQGEAAKGRAQPGAATILGARGWGFGILGVGFH